MTRNEFLRALEVRMTRALQRQPSHPLHQLCSDGFVLHSIPKDHSGPIQGIAWALGSTVFKRTLKIHLTHKAFLLWKNGQLETLLPRELEDDWLEYNEERAEITMRLRVHKSPAATVDDPIP